MEQPYTGRTVTQSDYQGGLDCRRKDYHLKKEGFSPRLEPIVPVCGETGFKGERLVGSERPWRQG
jgi:hypothetical protein